MINNETIQTISVITICFQLKQLYPHNTAFRVAHLCYGKVWPIGGNFSKVVEHYRPLFIASCR